MGSSARHSTGGDAALPSARKGSATQKSPHGPPRPHPIVALGRISDAISIIAVALRSLMATQQPEGKADIAGLGDHVITLEHGLRVLSRAYDELDLALGGTQP